MENKNNYETYYYIKEKDEIVQKIKSNMLGLGYMSDDNFIISYLDNNGEEQFMYIDNYKAKIIGYVPELDLTLIGKPIDGTFYLKGNPFNIDINEQFEFANS